MEILDLVLAWIPLAAAGIGALGSLGGSFISAGGAASANAQNVAMQNMANQQMLNAEMAKHAQNTAFMEDAQQHDIQMLGMNQAYNTAEAEKARKFSSDEARWSAATQMQFQERMANSQYQRAMEDMRKAGLNPILAYQQGGNAAPSGSSAQASGPSASSSGGGSAMAHASGAPSLRAANIVNDKEFIGRAMGNLVQSAMEVLRTHEDIDRIKQDAKEKEERSKVHTYDAVKKDMETIKIGREAEKVLEEKELVKAQTKNAKTLNQVIEGEAGNMSRYGKKEAPDTIERMLRTLQEYTEKNGTVMPAPAPWDHSKRLF